MVVVLPLLLIGCSNSSQSISSSSSSSNRAASDSGGASSSSSVKISSQSSQQATSGSNPKVNNMGSNTTKMNTTLQPSPNPRMLIYNAHLSIKVKNDEQFQKIVEKDVQGDQGYIVDMTQDHNKDILTSHLTIRVPQPHFYTLLNEIKKGSDKIVHSEISGKDVTKQYVDLEAHLKAKQLVEDRLKSFMKKASNTTDLLKISDELGTVQSEIESIKGQMNYLENQSALSTITLDITETKITIPKLHTQDLNTWQKAQKAFMTTIQGFATFCSWLFVFLVGAAPILVVILVGALLYFVWRKKRKQKEK